MTFVNFRNNSALFTVGPLFNVGTACAFSCYFFSSQFKMYIKCKKAELKIQLNFISIPTKLNLISSLLKNHVNNSKKMLIMSKIAER